MISQEAHEADDAGIDEGAFLPEAQRRKRGTGVVIPKPDIRIVRIRQCTVYLNSTVVVDTQTALVIRGAAVDIQLAVDLEHTAVSHRQHAVDRQYATVSDSQLASDKKLEVIGDDQVLGEQRRFIDDILCRTAVYGVSQPLYW